MEEYLNEYILVVQEGQGEFSLYTFWIPFLVNAPPCWKTLLADQVICVIKWY